MALFASNTPQQSNHLVEFLAGKMFMRGKMIVPDPRKGKIYLHQTDDGLMHFCWKDATTNNVEDDLIVFPEDAEFIRVDKCTTGRVYLLSFKNPARKMFFWMQAFNNDKDEEHVKKVNDLLNNPPALEVGGRQRRGEGGRGGDMNDQMSMVSQLFNLNAAGGAAGESLQNALPGVDHRQMMQLLSIMGAGGGAGLGDLFHQPDRAADGGRGQSASIISHRPAVATASASSRVPAAMSASVGHQQETSAPKPSTGPTKLIDSVDFSKILAEVGASHGITPQANREQVDLENILVAKNVDPVLVKRPEAVDRLLPHLPSEQPAKQDKQELGDTLRSPQFRQAVGVFGAALQSGQLGSCMQQFGLSPDVIRAVEKGDVQSIAEMLQKGNEDSAASSSAESKTTDSKKNDDSQTKKDQEDETAKDDKNDAMDLD